MFQLSKYFNGKVNVTENGLDLAIVTVTKYTGSVVRKLFPKFLIFFDEK